MRVNIGDIRLFFDIEGAKLRPDGAKMREVPTLILLHGGPGFDHSSFKPAFSRVAEIAQVIYLDHRGNGRSDRGDPAKWNLPQWGDDLVAFCDALEIAHPIVLGLSFGGMVAMAYATRHPDHPSKLVLSSTAAVTRQDRSLEMFEKLGGPEAREVARRFFSSPGPETMNAYREKCLPLYNRTPSDPDQLRRSVMNPQLMADFFNHEEHKFNFLSDLARIKCPTLISAGTHDPITPLADSKDIAAAMAPGVARLEVFENAGHGVHRDQPDRFFTILNEFILA